MMEYLKKITIARDRLTAAGEKLKDSQVILITLGGLGSEYQSFVTSITTRFDKNMTFSHLKHLLMDHELQFSPTLKIDANVAVKNRNDDRRDKITYQICTKKGHGYKYSR